MFGIDINVLAIILLTAIAAGAVAYGLLFSELESQKKADSRVKRVKTAETDLGKVKAARDRVSEMSKRRKSVQDSLKELERKQEERNKKTSPTLKVKFTQAGLNISLTQFYIFSAILAGLFGVLALVGGMPLYVVAGVLIVAGVGLPKLILSFLIKRRMKKFIEEFPNALDVMVRSIKSGLPLNDSFRLIGSEGTEPVKSEFRRVVETQQMGLGIPEACARMYNTVPLQEVSFFAIVIAIQAQAGGNLSEALGNLSRVLRDRKKMRAKVGALSMEAKASAAIIGSLPFVVSILVKIASPAYLDILFTDPRGHLILGISAVWMSMGILVMRNMTNFDI